MHLHNSTAYRNNLYCGSSCALDTALMHAPHELMLIELHPDRCEYPVRVTLELRLTTRATGTFDNMGLLVA